MPDEATTIDPTDTDPGQTPDDPAQGDTTDWKAEARKWEGRARTNRTAADQAKQQHSKLLTAVAEQLGIKADDATPEQLTEQLTAARSETATARTQLAVYKAAARNGADPDRLLDSASFLGQIATLDAADPAAIDQAIKQAVESNAFFAANQQPKGAGFRELNNPPAQASNTDAEALAVLGFGN